MEKIFIYILLGFLALCGIFMLLHFGSKEHILRLATIGSFLLLSPVFLNILFYNNIARRKNENH